MNHVVCWKCKGKNKVQQIQTVRTHTLVLHHRNLYLQNPTSCPSASKDASLLNTPQDLHLKRNIYGRVMFNKLLSLPQAMLRLQNLPSHNNPKARQSQPPLKNNTVLPFLLFSNHKPHPFFCTSKERQQVKTVGAITYMNSMEIPAAEISPYLVQWTVQ